MQKITPCAYSYSSHGVTHSVNQHVTQPAVPTCKRPLRGLGGQHALATTNRPHAAAAEVLTHAPRQGKGPVQVGRVFPALLLCCGA
jgi:hypothetical protein